jgi:hypothetical protein
MLARPLLVLITLALSLAACASAGPSPGGPLTPGSEMPATVRHGVDKDGVYCGDPRDWKRPAQVDADAVYAQIEEYRQICSDGLRKGDPAYCVLMSKATKKFKAACQAAAKEGGYDLVAKRGCIQGAESVPTITESVIGKL